MSRTPQITAADIRELLNSPAEQPVLYIQLDENDGNPGDLAVWAAALVQHHTVVLTREDAQDLLGDTPDADTITDCLPQIQEEVDAIYSTLTDSHA